MRNRIRFIFAAALLVFLMGGTSGCVVPLLGAGMALDATVFKEANANRASRMAAASVKKAENALLAAADKGRYQKVRDLLRRQVNPNARDENGETALMKAARKGHVDVVGLLWDAGADVNAADTSGNTALSMAAAAGQRDTVEVLVAAGAQASPQNQQEVPRDPK